MFAAALGSSPVIHRTVITAIRYITVATVRICSVASARVNVDFERIRNSFRVRSGIHMDQHITHTERNHMITRWLEMQERWAADQGQRHSDLVSLILDPNWDDWAAIDRRGSRLYLGRKAKRSS